MVPRVDRLPAAATGQRGFKLVGLKRRPHRFQDDAELAMILFVEPLGTGLAEVSRLEDADAAQDLLRREQGKLAPPV